MTRYYVCVFVPGIFGAHHIVAEGIKVCPSHPMRGLENRIDKAVKMIEGWHYKKGGYLVLADEVRKIIGIEEE
jgi:hypothetical protein